MSIVQLPTILPAQVGIFPQMKRMVTTDSLATITTAGYLNPISLQSNPVGVDDVLEVLYSYDQQTHVGTYGVFTVSISNGIITLSQWVNPADVLLPVVDGDFANFNGTTGQIKDAGYSPSNAAKTKVVMANAATVADHIMVSTDTAGTAGNKTGTAINDGDLQAGRSGIQGSLFAFPSTAASGKFGLIANNNAGDFIVDIQNASHGQTTAYTIADIGASSGGIPVATAAFKMKQVAQAAVAGGAAAQTVTDAFCTSASNVIAVWNDTTNAVSIEKVAAGNGSFVVTSSGDPGASHLNYIIMK